MQLYLKITAGLLLLVQAFHLASLQDSTDSPGRTIDKSWFRELPKNTVGSQNAAVTEEETEYDQGADATALESINDFNSGIASGSMALKSGEEENVASQEKYENETSNDLPVSDKFPTFATNQPELPDATVSPTTATTDPTNSSQINMTEAKEEFYNFTTHLSAQNSTSFSDYSNHTDLQTTTMAPESNATQESTTKPDKDTGLTNATESTNTTTITAITTTTTTTTPEINETPSTTSSTTVFLSETTETSPATMTTIALNTPEKANKTDKSAASGSSSERGLAADSHNSKRKKMWGAVLGITVAVACVGLVAYIILKKKHQKGFSHRKLVEEYPADPVLRLDNNEPLDLNFGGSAYYNPGLQGDNIQMTNFPEHH
ncbi:mucin-15 [Siniperca chuatsi]|uniref:mucin-15 n=1 Tax=Siniperca chuatsi TaxID=119488 RepID=UPI001CE1C33F|nr:mucin-15 [Siniperca chuatsi]